MEKLDHTHCVELLSVIDDDENGLMYLVLEYVGCGRGGRVLAKANHSLTSCCHEP